MSEAPVASLARLFEEADSLNRQALALLERGDTAALEPLFLRKQALSEELAALQGALERPEGPQAGKLLEKAFQAQKAAATSEARLAESLSRIVPGSGKAAQAYSKIKLESRASKLDNSI